MKSPTAPVSVSEPAGGAIGEPHCPPGTPPVCEQPDALVDDQDTVKLCPATTPLAGLNEIVAVGGGAGSTVRITGADVTLGLRAAGLQVIDSWYEPEWAGPSVSVPCGRGSESKGSRLMLTIGMLGVVFRPQFERFEFQVSVT